MAELLLELFSEEIPARMQIDATHQIKELFSKKFAEHSIKYNNIESFATPRRLSLFVEGLEELLPDILVEKRGPRKEAPQQAIDGFLRSVNMTLDQLEIRLIGKDEFYFANYTEKGSHTADILLKLIPEILHNFSWPKSMKWGNYDIKWVRPLRNILCIFANKTLPIKFGHLIANNKSYGHRFLAPQEFEVKSFAEYKEKLKKQYVILNHYERRSLILQQITDLASKNNLSIGKDDGLVDEVCGLVEWPVALMGQFDQSFLSVPKEALTTAMRSHQKYFYLTKTDGSLSNHFITIANITTSDNGAIIIRGNEKVLRARLSDANFFFNIDKQKTSNTRIEELKNVTFHAKLGSIYDKVIRIKELSSCLNNFIKADNNLVEQASLLCKSDLTSTMVGEFPELQGIMGGYYTDIEGYKKEVVEAVRDLYKPMGAEDTSPTNPVSIIIAIADKIDSLSGLFSANEKPTGSKDPFALRRAALGVIKIILDNKLRFDLNIILNKSLELYKIPHEKINIIRLELQEFFTERLKFLLKNQSIRHDIISAVFDTKLYDLYDLLNKANAIQKFIESSNGSKLLIAYKRASNIVINEEKKHNTNYNISPNINLLQAKEEKELFNALEIAKKSIKNALANNDIDNCLQGLEPLREPIDNFFNKVMVNVEEEELRKNRLSLLAAIRGLLETIANFQLVETNV